MSASFRSKIGIGNLMNKKQKCYPSHPQRQIR